MIEDDIPPVKETGPKRGGPRKSPETEDGAQDVAQEGVEPLQGDAELAAVPVPTYDGSEEPESEDPDDAGEADS